MIRQTSMFFKACTVVAMATVLPLQGFGCGVDFTVPKDHFNGVNEYGYVSYWDKIADLDLGEGLFLPLVIGFQSDREWSSPYLGYGWILPIFDSNLVQTGENNFEMIAPDGYTVPLGRDGKKPALIFGPRGWKGEISGDSISLWAACGWKLTYTKGKITSIGTPNGKTLLISRDATGVAKEATYDGKVVVRVEHDFNGLVTSLVLGEKRIAFEQTEKPRMQSILGKNVLAGKDMSLGKVSSAYDTIKTYEYGLTDNLQPKLTVTEVGKSPRQIVWDPTSRFIMADGDWKYDIKPSPTKGFNATIARSNISGCNEFWDYDPAKGVETTKALDGTTTTVSWFVSGPFSGKKRSIVIASSTGTQKKAMFAYDEKGRLVRQQDFNGKTVKLYYDTFDRLTHAIDEQSGLVIAERAYDSQGREILNKMFDKTVKTHFSSAQDFTKIRASLSANGSDAANYAIREISDQGGNRQVLVKTEQQSEWK